MKKVFLALFAVAVVTSVCFADETPVLSSSDKSAKTSQTSGTAVPTQPSNSTASPAAVKTIVFTGAVDSIASGDTLSGAAAQITVTDDKGQLTVFTVSSNTAIIGKDGNQITLGWISQNDAVNITYFIDQDGITKTVKSIQVLKDK